MSYGGWEWGMGVRQRVGAMLNTGMDGLTLVVYFWERMVWDGCNDTRNDWTRTEQRKMPSRWGKDGDLVAFGAGSQPSV